MIRDIGETGIAAHATRYSFCWHPELGHQIDVEYTGVRHDDRWAIRRAGRRCLSRAGEWDHEPIPSERDGDWLDGHRFTRDEAILIGLRLETLAGVNAPWVNVPRHESERLEAASRGAVAHILGGAS